MYRVRGSGLTSATVDHSAHVLVQMTDSSGRPHQQEQRISAQLVSNPDSNSQPRVTSLPVIMTSLSEYEVSYTPVSRGQHKLSILVNGCHINGSPFAVTAYPNPRHLGEPVNYLPNVSGPYGIAFNKRNEVIVSEVEGQRLSVFDNKRQKIRTIPLYIVIVHT